MTGTLTNIGDEATYTFTGSAGQQIFFNSLENTTYIYAILTDPYGNTSSAPTSLRQPRPLHADPGGYLYPDPLYPDNHTGSYDFVLDDTSAATTILDPNTVRPRPPRHRPLTTNLYQLSGTAGENLTFEV